MKIKKYIAKTMPEAMNQIRKELGTDAVILNSKEIFDGGFLGLFKKRKIEVIAALDPQPIPSGTDQQNKTSVIKNKVQQKESLNETVLTELKQMKKIIEQQTWKQEQPFFALYQQMYDHLLEQEVSPDIAGTIVETILQQHKENNLTPTVATMIKDTKKEIKNRLQTKPFEGITYSKKIIQFVGPTGVGKTTTIAKLAAKSMLNDNKKVAFITADTYRIAAIEQLKTYAKILDIPIEVVFSAADYTDAIQKFAEYDLIFVDTAGRNFRDEAYVNELRENIDFTNATETFLVLSLTAKQKDLEEVLHSFRHVPIKEMIFTKIDETRQYGSMLTIAINNNASIAYLSNGQNVPDDIVKASPEIISNLLLEEFSDA